MKVKARGSTLSLLWVMKCWKLDRGNGCKTKCHGVVHLKNSDIEALMKKKKGKKILVGSIRTWCNT